MCTLEPRLSGNTFSSLLKKADFRTDDVIFLTACIYVYIYCNTCIRFNENSFIFALSMYIDRFIQLLKLLSLYVPWV